MAKLHPGLYAALLTKSLQKLLEPRDFENVIDLEKTEAPAFLSNKLRQLIQRSLESKTNMVYLLLKFEICK